MNATLSLYFRYFDGKFYSWPKLSQISRKDDLIMCRKPMVPGFFRTTREELQVIVSFLGMVSLRVIVFTDRVPKFGKYFSGYQELAENRVWCIANWKTIFFFVQFLAYIFWQIWRKGQLTLTLKPQFSMVFPKSETQAGIGTFSIIYVVQSVTISVHCSVFWIINHIVECCIY